MSCIVKESINMSAMPHPFHPTQKQLDHNQTLGASPDGAIMLFLVCCELETDMKIDKSFAFSQPRAVLKPQTAMTSFTVPVAHERIH